MKWDTRQMAGRAASVVTIWGVSKFLSSKPGDRAASKVDGKVEKVGRKTKRAVRSGVRNARANRGWAAAGLAALAVGAAFLGKAASKR